MLELSCTKTLTKNDYVLIKVAPDTYLGHLRMKTIICKIYYFTALITTMALYFSCSSNSGKFPEYHGEITFDENLNVQDWGRSGQSTPDGNYLYYGSVTLYSEDGSSRDFPCYEGKKGLEKGCRGVIYADKFYNLDRNEWVNIGGVRYKASDILD